MPCHAMKAIYLALVVMFVWVPTRLVGALFPSVMPVKVSQVHKPVAYIRRVRASSACEALLQEQASRSLEARAILCTRLISPK